MFVGVHALMGQLIAPELAITDDEGKAFMDAAKNVMRHYSVRTTQKTVDWIAFIGTTVGIYGTRAIAINIRVREEKAQKRGEQPRPIEQPLNTAPIPKPNGQAKPVVITVSNEQPVIVPALEIDPFA
jgi:hypothetical protein